MSEAVINQKKKKSFKLPDIHFRMPKYYDFMMHLAILVLLVFGSVMIASTSVGKSASGMGVVVKAIIKQAIFVVISFLIMQIMAANFTKWLSKDVMAKRDITVTMNRKIKKRNTSLFMLLGYGIIGLCALTLFMPAVNGAHCWIPLGFMSLQPAEFAKVYMVILIGMLVNRYATYRKTFLDYTKQMLIFFVPVVLIILKQPDLGTLIVFCTIVGVCLLIPTHPAIKNLRIFILFCFILVFALLLFCMSDVGLAFLEKLNLGYKLARFKNAVDPFEDIYGDGYNMVYSLYAIAHGGITGLGLGASEQKFGYLPEAQTDFIFSITIEELGIFGLAIIVICYGIIIYKLLYYALKTKSEGYKVILIGCAVYLLTHFILNVGGVSAFIPLTGVPLLFISSGGSSLMSIMTLLGICQSIIALTRNQMRHLT